MSHPLTTLITAIHDAPQRCVLAVTGGGSGAIARLLSVPGASRTLLEAVVPYSGAAIERFLGFVPERACDESTALVMAVTAYLRAVDLSGSGDGPPIGVAATAALVSDRPKRGDHRGLVAVQTADTTRITRLDLDKGSRSREAEEDLVAAVILDELAAACGIADRPAIGLGDGDAIRQRQVEAEPPLADVFGGRTPLTWSLPDGSFDSAPPATPAGILSGAFDPRHEGHERLQRVAEMILGGPVYYELPLKNADKPPLDFVSIADRRAAFSDVPLAVTAAATFVEKSRLFPGATFVVGADTAERIVAARFYDSPAAMAEALKTIGAQGCQFLVAGRLDADGFQDLDDLGLPAESGELFSAIPEDQFRCDISSTQLRDAAD